MNTNEYLINVLNRYTSSVDNQQASKYHNFLIPYFKDWNSSYYLNSFLSGSYAKSTNIKNSSDLDVFITISSNEPKNLKELYYSLFEYLTRKGFNTGMQNVSLKINYQGIKIDIVPAKLQSGYKDFHSLYVRSRDTWTQTNVNMQISKVKDSNRQNIIKLFKIWRYNRSNIDFPSFYLELSIIEALKYQQYDLFDNINTVFKYLESEFYDARVVDPGNSNNIISDDLSSTQKQSIKYQAFLDNKKTIDQIFY